MPGAYPLPDAVREVAAEWNHQSETGVIKPGTAATHAKVLGTLLKFSTARGAVMVCDVSNEVLNEWMFASHATDAKKGRVAATTPKLRRAVASSFYYTCFRLGITDNNVAANLPPQGNTPRYVKPFTEDEIEALKEASGFAFRETKSPSALALVLLGCSPGEVGSITCADIRLVEGRVRAYGGGSRYRGRWLPIDDPWCFEKLSARIKHLADKHPDDWATRYVAYDPRPDSDNDFAKRSAATSTTLTTVIDKAGLKRNGVNRVASIGEYLAQRVFAETGRIEAVAARLGINKLDDAARIVGYEWRAEYETSPPGGAE